MENRTDLDIRAVVALMRRQMWLIALVIGVCAIGAFGASKLQTKKYTASAAVQFNSDTAAAAASGLVEPEDLDPTATQQTNLNLVTLGAIADLAAVRLGHGVTASDVSHMVTSSPLEESNLVTVSATATSPSYAARVANVYAGAFVSSQQKLSSTAVQSAIAFVQAQYNQLDASGKSSVEGLDLLDRVETLKIYGEMQDPVSVVQGAVVPTAASSPKTTRNTLVGLFIGILLALTLAVARTHLDQRVTDVRDIEATLPEFPLLAVIPHLRPESGLESADSDAFQMLRASLRYFNVDQAMQVVLVGSAIPGEGKSTVAIHLALASASAGVRTVLVEGDLRRPGDAEVLGLGLSPGLVDALVSPDHDVSEFIQTFKMQGADRGLDVLVAGGRPPNAAELVESDAMANLINRLRATYELVVIDSPPLTVVSDALAMTLRADGVLVVARVGVSTRAGLRRVSSQLDKLDTAVLGIAANDVTRGGSDYYYYGYQYADPDATARERGGAGKRPVIMAPSSPTERPDVDE